jgi:hypothetical protein
MFGYRVAVYEAVAGPDASTVPIGGAKVCVVDHPEIACATTDSDGTYAMTVPQVDAAVRWAVEFTAEGHIGSTVALAGDGWPSGASLRTDAWAATIAAHAGFTYPGNGTAFVAMAVRDLDSRPLAGAHAALSPASGVGPIYADGSGNPAPALTATSSSGVVFFGNVTPGPFTVAIDAPGLTCDCCDHGQALSWEWTGLSSGSVMAIAAADAITDNLYQNCQ